MDKKIAKIIKTLHCKLGQQIIYNDNVKTIKLNL